MLAGFKTILIGAALAVVPSITDYFAIVDWSFLGAKGALIASGVTMIVLRLITTTAVFKGKE